MNVTRDGLKGVLDVLLLFAVVASGVAMAAFFAAGLWLFSKGALMILGLIQPSGHAEAMVEAFAGLECLFIAPLGYLALIVMAELVRKVRLGGSQTPDLTADVGVLKSLVTSLIIAVISTHILGTVVGTEALTFQLIGPRLLVVVVLAAYWWLLQVAHRKGKLPGDSQ
jgi:hypothetical protein